MKFKDPKFKEKYSYVLRGVIYFLDLLPLIIISIIVYIPMYLFW